ncbi:hypothetical protein OUZ56_027945 [Daphnia magna]|uniref:Secreted protein n=1 Tax=Daphnia magna TaxID=35525 RepID=A0ABR0B2H7_9CRUS|nr:hypothetical protein OUZ56_027945 [Daphnia magna]
MFFFVFLFFKILFSKSAASAGNMTCGPTETERVCSPFAILVNKNHSQKNRLFLLDPAVILLLNSQTCWYPSALMKMLKITIY